MFASCIRGCHQDDCPQRLCPTHSVRHDVPETYVIDREGRIRYKHIGPMFEETWKDILAPLIRELKG